MKLEEFCCASFCAHRVRRPERCVRLGDPAGPSAGTHRRPARIGATLHTYAGLLRDRVFVGLVLVAGLMFGALFSYVAGSTFALQEFYGLDAQTFGLVFGVNAAGLIAATQVNPLLLKRFSPQLVLSAAIVSALVWTGALLVAALLGSVQFGLASFVTPLVGALATGDAVGMSTVMAGSVVAAAIVMVAMVRPWQLTDIDA